MFYLGLFVWVFGGWYWLVLLNSYCLVIWVYRIILYWFGVSFCCMVYWWDLKGYYRDFWGCPTLLWVGFCFGLFGGVLCVRFGLMRLGVRCIKFYHRPKGCYWLILMDFIIIYTKFLYFFNFYFFIEFSQLIWVGSKLEF